jgi:hypothetical protein
MAGSPVERGKNLSENSAQALRSNRKSVKLRYWHFMALEAKK